MFRKVFKYDLAAMVKPLAFIPAVWALAAAAALIIRVMENEVFSRFIVLEMVSGIAVFFCLAAVFCFPFAVIFFCLRRYFTHFFSDEGYLTFTLPVKRETLLWSKTLSSFLIAAAAFCAEAAAGALFLVLAPDGREFLQGIAGEVSLLLSNEAFLPLAILFGLGLIASLFGAFASAHFAMTQGQLLAKKHRILAALGIWYGISFIKRTVINGFSLIFFVALAEREASSLLEGAAALSYLYLALLLTLEIGCFFLLYLWNRHLLKAKLSLA